MQDHFDFVQLCRADSTDLIGLSLGGGLRLLREIGRSRPERRGMLTTNYAEAGGFLRSDPSLPRPELQFDFVVALVDAHARRNHLGHAIGRAHVCTPDTNAKLV